jgi:hypothetical protein
MAKLQVLFMVVCTIILVASVVVLWFELRATKRAHRVQIALQFYQQLQESHLQASIELICSQKVLLFRFNGHRKNDLVSPEVRQAQYDIVRFFAVIGRLMKRHDVDKEIFELMGNTIEETWQATRVYREQSSRTDDKVNSIDDFQWLYTEWLNWDYSHQNGWSSPSRSHNLANTNLSNGYDQESFIQQKAIS